MKNGFTLIELLAVIVILAIIATIATPIILSIIEDTKESATLRSAEYYLDAVETSVATAILKSTNINDGAYKLKDRDICLDSSCVQKLKVEIKGEIPESGTINIQDGQISGVTLFLDNKVITNSKNNELVYAELEYEIGDEVTFNPGDEDRTWNVIDEDATTVTLMLTQNLGTPVPWNVDGDNNYAPKDALEYLNYLTKNWTNVDSIENYTYINNLNGTTKPDGYQKIEIKNGVTKLTHKDGGTTELTGESKARILSLEELFEIASKTNTNLTEANLSAYIQRNLSTINEKLGTSLTTVEEGITFAFAIAPYLEYESKHIQLRWTVYGMMTKFGIEPEYDIAIPKYLYHNLYSNKLPYGYWLLSTNVYVSYSAWVVPNSGIVSLVKKESSYYGVRPVITIPKSKLAESK